MPDPDVPQNGACANPAAHPAAQTGLKRYVFPLLDGFSPLGFTCAIKAISAANEYRGKAYYMQLRLEKARNLLLQTNMPIAEITIACGFNAASHFSKCDRHHFGVPPSSQSTLSVS